MPEPTTIVAVCPACHAKVRAPKAAEGKRGKCPKCQSTVLIKQIVQTTQGEIEALAADALRDDCGPVQWRATTSEAQPKKMPEQTATSKVTPARISETVPAKPNRRRAALLVGSAAGILVLLAASWAVIGGGEKGTAPVAPQAAPTVNDREQKAERELAETRKQLADLQTEQRRVAEEHRKKTEELRAAEATRTASAEADRRRVAELAVSNELDKFKLVAKELKELDNKKKSDVLGYDLRALTVLVNSRLKPEDGGAADYRKKRQEMIDEAKTSLSTKLAAAVKELWARPQLADLPEDIKQRMEKQVAALEAEVKAALEEPYPDVKINYEIVRKDWEEKRVAQSESAKKWLRAYLSRVNGTPDARNANNAAHFLDAVHAAYLQTQLDAENVKRALGDLFVLGREVKFFFNNGVGDIIINYADFKHDHVTVGEAFAEFQKVAKTKLGVKDVFEGALTTPLFGPKR